MGFPWNAWTSRTHRVVRGLGDRKAALLKMHMSVHLSQRSNIETSKEMVDAIQSSGGVPGVHVILCSSLQIQKPSLNVKIADVSLISNIECNDRSLKIWKAYGIGPGKCIRLSEFSIPQVDLVKCDGERLPEAHFVKVKSRPEPRTTANSQWCSDTEQNEQTKTVIYGLMDRRNLKK